MNYLEVASEIFDWLAGLQVHQKQIIADRDNNIIYFELAHPIKGKVKVKMPIPDDTYFQSHGIGLKIATKNKKKIIIDVYDDGGILDPMDGKIPGTHYTTTHFALLGAILYHQNKKDDILEKVKEAIQFHLRTSKNEYIFDSWLYHWDFQNYAFLETYRLLKNYLTEEERHLWGYGLKSYKENNKNSLTNWIAMRAYSSCLRHQLFHSFLDKLKFEFRIRALNKARHTDGCYDDSRNSSRPIQYHVYTVALLHRIFQQTGNKQIETYFIEGVKYFIQFIDPDGCFNYLGRGQEQIFGSAVGLYALEAAKKVNQANTELYQFYINRMWNYLLTFKVKGHFPLVLNNRKNEEKFGWYDYHHLTVYNAFLGAWLGLIVLLKPGKVNERKPQKVKIIVSKPTQVAFFNNDKIFAVVFGGLGEYLSESALTFHHIWFDDVGWFFSCPGGPSPVIFGKITPVQDVEKNFFAPMANDYSGNWFIPACKKGKITQIDLETIEAHLNYGPFEVKRKISILENELTIEDQIHFLLDSEFSEFRFFNLPVITDKFIIEIPEMNKVYFICDKGTIQLEIFHSDFPMKGIERLETIKTAKGLAQVLSLREMDFKTQKSETKIIKFSLSKVG